MPRVVVAYVAPGVEWFAEVDLADGATVADALAATGAADAIPGASTLRCAIFGEAAPAATPLVDGDRIELTRPLVADPRLARRKRAAAKPLPRAAKPPRRARKATGGV